MVARRKQEVLGARGAEVMPFSLGTICPGPAGLRGHGGQPLAPRELWLAFFDKSLDGLFMVGSGEAVSLQR